MRVSGGSLKYGQYTIFAMHLLLFCIFIIMDHVYNESHIRGEDVRDGGNSSPAQPL